MSFNLDPELLESDSVDIYENGDGELVLEHHGTGTELVFTDDGRRVDGEEVSGPTGETGPSPVDVTDELTGEVAPTGSADQSYKVLGETDDASTRGMLGVNTAASGPSVGVEGRTDSPEGYGLYTADDARVDGALRSGVIDAVDARLDDWYTVDGETLADIDEAIQNHRYVRLKPGVRYTDETDTTITYDYTEFDGGYEDRYVCARGATLDFDGGIAVAVRDGNIRNAAFQWYGGRFLGSYIDVEPERETLPSGDGTNDNDGGGGVAFEITDSTGAVVDVRQIRRCRAGVVARNETVWCEQLDVTIQNAFKNRYGVVLLGNEAADVDEYIPAPSGDSGTESFRHADIDVWANVNIDGTALYTDEAAVYESDIEVTANLGSISTDAQETSQTGWYAGGGRFKGTRVKIHCEAPGPETGGVGIDIAKPPQRFPVETVGSFAQMDQNVDATAAVDGGGTVEAPLFYWHAPYFDVDDAADPDSRAVNGLTLRDGRTDDPVYRFAGDDMQVWTGLELKDSLLKLDRRDLTTERGYRNFQFAVHDGSGDYDIGLFRWMNGQDRWVRVEDNSVAITF